MNAESMIRLLNRLLEAELMAVEYYAIHADAIPESEIAEGVKAIIPAEVSHAANLAARIRELGGVPVGADKEASRKGREMGENSKLDGTLAMLKMELTEEQLAIKAYAEPVADIVYDLVTVEMLEEQLLDEMRHAKWLKQRIIAMEERAP